MQLVDVLPRQGEQCADFCFIFTAGGFFAEPLHLLRQGTGRQDIMRTAKPARRSLKAQTQRLHFPEQIGHGRNWRRGVKWHFGIPCPADHLHRSG